MNTESNVYFIVDFVSNAVKIGKANDVDQRICDLQTGNPNPLTLLHSIKYQSEDESFFYEKKFHKFFDHLRLNGEWFRFDEQLFRNFFLTENKSEPKSKRSPITVYTLFGEEIVRDIRTHPRCYFYPYLVAQIKENYEKSLSLTLPFRTMAYPTNGKSLLLPHSNRVDRVFISGKKHLENLALNKFLQNKELKLNELPINTIDNFMTTL